MTNELRLRVVELEELLDEVYDKLAGAYKLEQTVASLTAENERLRASVQQ